jgi:UDP-N-acetyl-alpha-D-muramoyl-L-alanyl-L-glutamate epimerase
MRRVRDRSMKRYRQFIFEGFSFERDARRIHLDYSLDGEVSFRETLCLPAKPAVEAEGLDGALRLLHLIGGVSYYKTCLPPEIVVRGEPPDAALAGFLDRIYENGLGELFYRNQVDFRGMIRFPSGAPRAEAPPNRLAPTGRALVPIGGGKDSLVTIEALKAAGRDVTLFRMGRHALIEEATRIAGVPLLTVERSLSPALFELNRQGALNGHVPITAYVSALTVVLALLYGFDLVAFSNERSASEGNTQYLGMEVNHQWSKGLEFERRLQDYLRTYISDGVRYVSLLRPLSELQIAERFAQHPEYFACATSCNANWKILGTTLRQDQLWCGDCPKCAFSFALFAAFIPRARLEAMFGANLFDSPGLQREYRRLLGLEGFKPFECVGTVEETRAAFYLASQRREHGDTAAMRCFEAEALPLVIDPDRLVAECLTSSAEHALPDELAALIGAPRHAH